MTAATAPTWTWLNPPPEPQRDLWWAAQRIAAPETGDHTARHRRGIVRLPYDLGEHSGGHAGDLVEAWVCCDPACGGVELGQHVLQLNHHCCDLAGPDPADRQHTVGLGWLHFTGFHHGPFTAWWEPTGGAR